ncbi:MAG: hypothetical protein IIB77_07895 [Proteobacteria bacterium]|nr:hypothetical protein [Pseudomonadota bacterium]
MHELFEQIMTELRGAWRFRWWAMATVWAVCLIGWPVVFSIPDQYEASARFYVNTTTRLDEVMGGVIIKADESSQISLVRQAMLSGPVLERVARETDIDLRATTAKAKEALLRRLQKAITITSTSTSRNRNTDDGIYLITYRDAERDKSLAVVDYLLDTFKEDVITGRAEGSDETVEFLVKEIAGYNTRLRAHEQSIADFKRQNVGLLPGESGGYFERMQQALGDTQALEAELMILTDRRRALTEQLRGEGPTLAEDSTASNAGIVVPRNALEARIVELEDSVQEMLTQYTEKWPGVIAARDQLEQLYQRRDKQLSELAAAGGQGGLVLSNNPVYQQIQIALNETEINIAAISGQVVAFRRQVTNLRAKVDIIPQIEARLAELTRDYDQIRTVYGELRERLEQERLRRSRIGWDGVTFQLIDPPKVGLAPVYPARTALLALVLITALGAGAGVAYLLHQFRPVFIDQRGLRNITGLPVLGSVSMTWLSRHRTQRRNELGVLLLAAVGIVVCLAVVLVYQDVGVETATNLRRMI